MRPTIPNVSVIMIALLVGCSGIGYIATSDPYVKIRQTYSLISEDRLLLAEDLLQQALVKFKETGDEAGMAEAYHAFGNLYKNEFYVHGRWSATFKQRDMYDGTYTKSLDSFEKCRDLYKQLGDGSGEAKCLVGAGNAYDLRGDRDKACEYYQQSLKTYIAAKQAGGNFKEPQMLTGYANMGVLIEAFMKNDGCGT
jgi:tetratricopeptide (TPR) repeat protein